MRHERTVHDGSCATRAGAGSSVSKAFVRRFSTWVQTVGLVAVILLLLAGCGDGDGGHVHEEDFIVFFPSPLEIGIRRPFDRPFDVVEVGVTPFVTPGIGSEPYVLVVSGIAFFDGAEVVFEAQASIQAAFLDPLGERVTEVLIVCDCVVDYVILHSPFGETTILFD